MVLEENVDIAPMSDSAIGPMVIPLLIVMLIAGIIVIAFTFIAAFAESAICVYLFSNRRLWILLPFLWGANLFIAILIGVLFMR